MKKYIVLGLLAVLGYYLMSIFLLVDFGLPHFAHGVKDVYLSSSKNILKVSNAVTAIVVNFRGFDTLGEVTVLFLSATAMSGILYKKRHDIGERSILFPASSIIRSGAKMLFPSITLLGIYVFIHGHLSPGGGFQGGTIIATGFLLMLLTYQNYSVSHNRLVWVESVAGMLFVIIGLAGYFMKGSFLENVLPVGELNDLFSGGVIGIIYVLVGFKVAAELIGIIYTILHEKG
ncbi:MAG TPA: sodium:proton antiporter [Saprospiraceae bacterium]|nr:sodium:proton antiporter [Saprospiraceae bacterium]